MATTMIRNELATPVILPVGGKTLTFMPKNDRSGADCILVNEDIINTSEFQIAQRRGLLSVVDDVNEQTDIIDTQAGLSDNAHAQRQQAVMSQVHRRQDRDLTSISCMGPGAREGQFCGAEIVTLAAKKGETAPLCSTHEHLSGQFYQTEVEVEGQDPQDGPTTQSVWKKIEIAQPRQPQG